MARSPRVRKADYRTQGGRVLIFPPSEIIDSVCERLILLLAGSSLDFSSEGGTVVGVMATRRRGGDRLELWLAGRREGEAPRMEWVREVKERKGVEDAGRECDSL